MKKLFSLFTIAATLFCTQATAFAAANPNTGDNSVVPLVVGVMAAAAVGLIVVLLLTRSKK